MTLSLTITHLYPDYLNLYGDLGNIIALKRRCEWLGIDYQVHLLNLGDTAIPEQADLYFMGGGQDQDQVRVIDDFHTLKRDAIQADTLNGVVFLGVCGGYQLMGNTFLMGNGEETKGLGIIDLETKAPGPNVKQRCTGNLIVEILPEIYQEMQAIYTKPKTIPQTLVGFENHSGQTYLGDGVRPLAKTISGFGNSAEAKYEGARFKNTFGSYMHGSLLPKNPHFADYLIWLALVKKYNDPDIRLPVLADQEEWDAHQYFVQRYA
ncbi:MAG: glutamine amidotransferase [Cyanothece sp. SIO2G6]|nr:glutamine amidotransferase [Cyanothece sp. SIO2G6]